MSSVGPGNAIANANLVWRVVDDEALILDLSSGVYFSLNPVATEVWQGLQAGNSLSQIAAAVAQTYGMAEDAVLEDVQQFVEDLKQSKLWDEPGNAHEQHA
jgi:Coenzyme PQQ synthesis protein D (PqqD)